MTETLSTIAEACMRDWHSGDIPSDSPWKIPFVILHVRDAMREDLKYEMLERRNNGESDRTDVEVFTVTFYDVEVKTETSTKRAFFDLPDSPMVMKYNKGLKHVADMRTPYKSMIPVANPAVTINLLHGSFERDNYGYTQEGLKVFFLRDVIRDGIKKVLVKMTLPAPESIGPNEALPLIPGNVARIKESVRKRMQQLLPNDRLNDNNPNLRPQNV